MNKIAPAHLACAAFVYIRQSTAYQVVNNLERQRRQYGLVERARQLGWEDAQLVGADPGGTVRPGLEKLPAAICEDGLAPWHQPCPERQRLAQFAGVLRPGRHTDCR
ncbi:recombinase family protein [Bradyrhizobium sp. UFLA05-109]